MTQHTVESLRALPHGDLVWIDRPDGTRLRCLVSEPSEASESTRRTIVLAHGILCDITIFNLVGPELVRLGHRVITFDQRAHGKSKCGSEGTTGSAMAGDYRAILERFDVKKGILVGHSMGAYLATRFCLEHSDVMRQRLDGMVLVSGNGGDVARFSRQTRVNAYLTKLGLGRIGFVSRRIARKLNRPAFGRRPDEVVYETCRQMFLGTDFGRLGGILDDMVLPDRHHYARLSTIELPTEVLCGDRDRLCPPWCSKEFGSIKGATNTWLPGIGHMPIYEAPQAIIDAVMKVAGGGVRAAS